MNQVGISVGEDARVGVERTSNGNSSSAKGVVGREGERLEEEIDLIKKDRALNDARNELLRS